MKKPSNQDNRDLRTRRLPREISLHALIFGGTASTTTPGETSLPTPAGLVGIKWPDSGGE